MPMDGILLNRIVNVIQENGPMRINRITQPSEHEFLIQCFAGKRINLLISTHPLYSRIQITKNKHSSTIENSHLLTILRKHLDGGILQSIKQTGFDRVFEFNINHRDDMGVIRPYRLIVELLGKYANVILVNDKNTVVDSLKRLGSFESTQRSIVPGATYEAPPVLNKQSIYDLENYNQDNALRHQFEGVSPLLENEILFRLKTQEPKTIIKDIMDSHDIYIHDKEFHLIELTHLNKPYVKYPLMEGLDIFYKGAQIQEQIKSHTGDILKAIKREIKRTKVKLPKLYDDLDRAQNSDYLRMYGELLFAYHSEAPSGYRSIDLQDFEGNDIEIALDPKLNGKANANLYFKKYRKAKTSLSYIEEQIEITEDKLNYYEALQTQTQQANVEDAQEIVQELMDAGLLRMKRKPVTKKKKPNYLTIIYDEETTIFVGKNNIQNEYLTFKIAKKEDTWFHAANTFGAHVIIKSPALDETKIRLCAHLAAYYSKARLGSSVEVYYTECRNIKKIPGKQPGMVRISSHKSIFIDPDEDYIHTYLSE